MLAPASQDLVTFDPESAPQLIVFVDAEEEFQWNTFSSGAVSVRNIAAQVRAQDIMGEFGLQPTYLVDYAVASQPEGYQPLKEMRDSGNCTIGAQLHPWINPPLDEQLTVRNTYHGNLPAALERAKIECLTRTISDNFGVRPTVFKAGRYGTGPNTAAALLASGYRIDASVMPLTDFSADGGPDHSGAPVTPYWVDSRRRLLEIPNTVGLVGAMESVSHRGAHAVFNGVSRSLRVPGFMARLGLLERIRLTPEGISLDEARRLTLTMLRRGHRLFVLSYHSSSLLPGGAPYVATEADLAAFLAWLRGYFLFFFGPLSGRPATAEGLYSLLQRQEASEAAADVLAMPALAVA